MIVSLCRTPTMSSKTKTSSKQARPRKLPQMEAIVTRHKSAQLRRQLRDKKESIAKINQMTTLLTSPTSQKKSTSFKFQRPRQPDSTKVKASSKKVKKAPKTPEKRKQRVSESQGSLEYYPNKLKRKVEAKKIMLKPKHELKVIGRTKISKRKLAVPQKGIKSPSGSKRQRPDPPTLEPRGLRSLSIEEMARLTDESDSLNDEDWLEILTCPSPVWWEDPPDANYSEDAICLSDDILCRRKSGEQKNTKKEEEKNENIETKSSSNVNDQIITETETDIPAIKQGDNKFMNKRNKLENLLGSLKYKLGCAQIPLSDNINHKKTNNDNLSNKNDDKTEKIKDPNNTINKKEINEKVIGEFYQNKIMDNRVAETEDDDENNKRKLKRTSESTEGDDPFSNLRDDDLLNDLENMDIPIESESGTDVYSIIDDSTPSTSDSFLGSGKDFNTLKPNLIKNVNNVELKKFKVNEKNNMKIGNVNAKIYKKDRDYQENNIDDKLAPTMISKGRDNINMVLSDSLDTNNINVKSFEKLKKHKKGYPKIITNVTDNPKIDLKVSYRNKNIVPNENLESESNKTKATVKVKTSAVPRGDKSQCMTVYKIISNEGLVSSEVLNESSVSDNSTVADKEQNSIPLDAVKNRLDLFYKKFKNSHQKRLRKSEIIICNNLNLHTQNEDQVETDIHEEVMEENATKDQIDRKVNDESSLCDSCDPKVKAIVVSNKNRVNYCLKCSCIFDTENCAYCVRKDKCDDETMASDSGMSEKQSCEIIAETGNEQS